MGKRKLIGRVCVQRGLNKVGSRDALKYLHFLAVVKSSFSLSFKSLTHSGLCLQRELTLLQFRARYLGTHQLLLCCLLQT